MKNKYYIYVCAGIIVALAAVLMIRSDRKEDEILRVPSVWQTSTSTLAQSLLTSENANQFAHKFRKFSFLYPKEMTVANFLDENDNEVILIQNTEKGQGFQITLSPFDEKTNTLSVERVKKDLPDLAIEKVEAVEIGSAGKGLAFISDNEAFGGQSREVWFVHGGFLYQISTYSHLDPLIQSVLNTWKFE
jgi:hypothetical protein